MIFRPGNIVFDVLFVISLIYFCSIFVEVRLVMCEILINPCFKNELVDKLVKKSDRNLSVLFYSSTIV